MHGVCGVRTGGGRRRSGEPRGGVLCRRSGEESCGGGGRLDRSRGGGTELNECLLGSAAPPPPFLTDEERRWDEAVAPVAPPALPLRPCRALPSRPSRAGSPSAPPPPPPLPLGAVEARRSRARFLVAWLTIERAREAKCSVLSVSVICPRGVQAVAGGAGGAGDGDRCQAAALGLTTEGRASRLCGWARRGGPAGGLPAWARARSCRA